MCKTNRGSHTAINGGGKWKYKAVIYMAETFEIKLRIHSENELYNSLDEDHQTISSDVIDYLYSRYQEKDLCDKLKLHIVSDDSIDVDNVRDAFRCYLDLQRKTLAKERRLNAIKQIWMFGIGVLFIGFRLIASDRLPALSGEIISTIGAFSMWEATSIWIVENPKNRISRGWLNMISKTQILCDKVYGSEANEAERG